MAGLPLHQTLLLSQCGMEGELSGMRHTAATCTVRAQTLLRWCGADISCRQTPHSLADMNIQHCFASPWINPTEQLQEHLHDSLFHSATNYELFPPPAFPRQSLSDSFKLFARWHKDGINNPDPWLDVDLNKIDLWFLHLLCYEKRRCMSISEAVQSVHAGTKP